MSHKTNPTSLRLLYSNTNFASAWFSDTFYQEAFVNECRTRLYLQELLKITASSPPLICVQSYYRKSTILYIAHDARGIRREKEFFFGVRALRKQKQEEPKLTSGSRRTNQQLSRTQIERAKLFHETARAYNMCSLQFETTFSSAHLKLSANASPPSTSKAQIEQRLYANTFRAPAEKTWCEGAAFYLKQALLGNSGNTFHFLLPFLALHDTRDRGSQKNRATSLHGISSKSKSQARVCCNLDCVRVVWDFQNACSLIDHIINLLQRRVLWRQIRRNIFRELELNESVKGIRLCFSGRSGGTSKKAQKSKVETHSCGVIALNTFSSRVSFASKSAYTPWGKIGVKVWIAFNC